VLGAAPDAVPLVLEAPLVAEPAPPLEEAPPPEALEPTPFFPVTPPLPQADVNANVAVASEHQSRRALIACIGAPPKPRQDLTANARNSLASSTG